MGELMRIGEIGQDTAIQIQTTEGAIAMSVNDVLRWIAPTGTPPGEALKFVMTCRAAKVNPFLKEAHLVPMGGKYETIIDKSGWLRQAEEHPEYDGFEAGIVLRTITKHKDERGKDLPSTYGPLEDHEGAIQPSGYQLVGGWAKVYRKDRRRPVAARVSLNEYRKNTPNWETMPCTMIRKVALVQALREAKFLVGGAYDRDEIPSLDDEAFNIASTPTPAAQPAEVREAIEVEFRAIPTHQLDAGLASELEAAIQAVGMLDFERDQILARRGVRSIAELGQHDARELLTKLRHIIDQDGAGTTLLPDPKPAGGDAEAVEAEVVAN